MSMTVEQLAKEMGVSTNDVLSLANLVMGYIISDDADKVFLEMTQEQQVDMIHAYVAHAAKKMKEFQISYMTNTDVKSLFNDMVYCACNDLQS